MSKSQEIYVKHNLQCFTDYFELRGMLFRYWCLLDDYSMQSDYEHEFKFTDLFGLSFVHISLDVSSNQVTFRIQEQWNDKYSDPTTKEYVNLKQQMAEEVNQIKQCFFFSNFSSPK